MSTAATTTITKPHIELRPFESLGGEDHSWLDAHHRQSFARYHNPERMNWGSLRVWNDDTIAPGTGFPTHPHSDMKIITSVRKGAITHRDNRGNEGRTGAGDIEAKARDGAPITQAQTVTVTALEDSEIVLVDAVRNQDTSLTNAGTREPVPIPVTGSLSFLHAKY